MKKHFDEMKKAGLSLAFFALISVMFVALTDQITQDKIAKNQALMLLQALNEVVPPQTYDNDLAHAKITLTSQQTGFERDASVYLASKHNLPVAAIFEVTTLKGYSGAITLLVGVRASDHSITGVRVVKHTETPGLGDKMESIKSNWIFSFNGKSLGNPDINGWQVKKDGGQFDQFTGATITPRAVVNMVKSTLLYANEHMAALFKKLPLMPQNPQEKMQ